MALSRIHLRSSTLYCTREAVRVLVSMVIGGGKPHRRPTSIAITGAASGLGEGLALHYARDGVHLHLSSLPSEKSALARVAATCRERGATVTTRPVDVTDRVSVDAWLTTADAATPVDLVIANAGVSEGTVGFRGDDQLAEAVRAVFAVNIDGVINTVFALLSKMRERGHGQVVIVRVSDLANC